MNPLRRRTVRERVRVGWHWVTVRRGGKAVRVKRGGHVKTIKVVKLVQQCTTKRVRTGPQRWRVERICRTPQARATKTLNVPYGQPVTVHGLYTTGQGVPLGGQPVQIFAAPNNGFAPVQPGRRRHHRPLTEAGRPRFPPDRRKSSER